MLAKTDIGEVVLREIRTLLLEDSDEDQAISGETRLEDLAINSLTLARLLIQLEDALGADPFAQGDAAVADIRSVNDLIGAYQSAVASGAKAGRQVEEG